jgi:hypothetical protein
MFVVLYKNGGSVETNLGGLRPSQDRMALAVARTMQQGDELPAGEILSATRLAR